MLDRWVDILQLSWGLTGFLACSIAGATVFQELRITREIMLGRISGKERVSELGRQIADCHHMASETFFLTMILGGAGFVVQVCAILFPSRHHGHPPTILIVSALACALISMASVGISAFFRDVTVIRIPVHAFGGAFYAGMSVIAVLDYFS